LSQSNAHYFSSRDFLTVATSGGFRQRWRALFFVLALGSLPCACDSSKETNQKTVDGGGSGGKSSTSSGGGSTTNSGGALPGTGGNQTASGGTVSSTGGSTTTAGGTVSSTGGSTTTAGGTTGTGGVPTSTSNRKFHTEGWTPASGDVWIASDGSDSADGTEAAPFKSLSFAISKASGKTVWVKAGTYSMKGTELSGSNIKVSGVTSGPMPVFSHSSPFQIPGSNNHLRYLELTASGGEGCIRSKGGKNNTFEWLKMHDCNNTGFQISDGAADNKIINVDSYMNYDPAKGGENADGFAAKFSLGKGNLFLGCRAYNNSDDGWDFWLAGDDSPITMKYCWAFDMKHPIASVAADGNGIKLGTPANRSSTGGNAPHQLSDCFAFHNPATGFNANGNQSGKVTCTGCGAWGNTKDWAAGTLGKEEDTPGKDIVHTGDIVLSVTAEQAKAAKRDENGNLPDIETL
jgi:hypothetical protein